MSPPQLQPRPASHQPAPASHPTMENHETECYILQSLELLADLATSPDSHCCGQGGGRGSQAWAPRDSLGGADSATSPLNTPRFNPWEASSSFQQVYQRTVEGQQQHPPLQPKPSVTITSDHSSKVAPPIESQINQYHAHVPPQYASSGDSAQSPPKPEDKDIKRVRNTAASARFRAKKKRREELLVHEARETQEMLTKLGNRVTELETENRWLKGLIMDKSEATIRREMKNTASERKGSEHTDGVGTEEK